MVNYSIFGKSELMKLGSSLVEFLGCLMQVMCLLLRKCLESAFIADTDQAVNEVTFSVKNLFKVYWFTPPDRLRAVAALETLFRELTVFHGGSIGECGKSLAVLFDDALERLLGWPGRWRRGSSFRIVSLY
jgi:hypothetical protein